jgi:integration host factor subunit alpha
LNLISSFIKASSLFSGYNCPVVKATSTTEKHTAASQGLGRLLCRSPLPILSSQKSICSFLLQYRQRGGQTGRGVKMTKAEIITRVNEKVVISRRDAAKVVDATFNIIKSCLERGEKVKISGFGNFVVNARRPRKGCNPQTGAEMIIVGRKVLTFKASRIVKKSLNTVSSGNSDASPPHPLQHSELTVVLPPPLPER